MQLNHAVQQLGTETAFKVLAKAKDLETQGKDIVHLEIGQPDFPTPTHIAAAGKQAIDEGWTSYGPTCGYPEFRDLIAQHISDTRNIDVKGSRVVVTPGGKPVMFYTILALVDPGDEVLYPDPGFPIYRSLINYIGGKAVPLPLLEENDFSFDVEKLETLISGNTKLLILNSPQNPTGGVLKKKDLEAIATLCVKHDVVILTDEIYSELLYDDDFESITQFDGVAERAVILDGFSKTYSMTGWRLGYGVFPEWMVDSIERLMVNSNSCTASFSQRAGMAALSGPQDALKDMRAEFHRRRDFFIEGLNKLPGISCRIPKGAFYAFANVSALPISSKELEGRLLEEAGVACLAGDGFGEQGRGFIRFSYANSIENIGEALRRIEAFVKVL
ncbi:MAG: pyridoxal phosphate-dependent aminotransferase [Cyanothece sp. SIO1E1]|nr:pyridoxal phosphate-dependent aminotransferase [Cyanothece sp. SIO1E1]